MQSGYVKLWRKSIENGWLQNPNLWTFWCYCLIKASHKEITVTVGLQRVELKPGQFVFGRVKASKDLRINESAIYRLVKFLENSGNIEVKSNNKFSIITIINWSIYQGDKIPNEQQMNNKRTTSEHKQEYKTLKKNIYGEFKNVRLTDDEFEKLKTKFNSTHLDRIEALSQYIEQKGKKYKSHYATILTWDRNDKKKNPPKTILTGDEALHYEG